MEADRTDVDALVRLVWDYHVLGVEPRPSDLIFVLGSNDLRVADHAAALWERRLAPLVAVSGKSGRLTEGLFGKCEADAFAERMMALGVPASALILEREATNTGENIRFTRRLLAEKGIVAGSAICVQKPFMERRTFATMARQWPELPCTISSPPLDFAAWCAGATDPDEVISTMVGDLQRIIAYPGLGYQIPQEVPLPVLAAMRELIRLGHDRHPVPPPEGRTDEG